MSHVPCSQHMLGGLCLADYRCPALGEVFVDVGCNAVCYRLYLLNSIALPMLSGNTPGGVDPVEMFPGGEVLCVGGCQEILDRCSQGSFDDGLFVFQVVGDNEDGVSVGDAP